MGRTTLLTADHACKQCALITSHTRRNLCSGVWNSPKQSPLVLCMKVNTDSSANMRREGRKRRWRRKAQIAWEHFSVMHWIKFPRLLASRHLPPTTVTGRGDPSKAWAATDAHQHLTSPLLSPAKETSPSPASSQVRVKLTLYRMVHGGIWVFWNSSVKCGSLYNSITIQTRDCPGHGVLFHRHQPES